MPFARLANRRQVVNPGSVGMPYGRAGAHWALLSAGAVELRRTAYDVPAACASVCAESAYPDIAEWTDYFLHSRASDADALAVMAPRDGRLPAPVAASSPREGGDAERVGREGKQRVNGPPARSQRADRRPPMTLTYRQERLLRHADRALSQSDPDLATMLSIFAQITAAEGLPAWEQLGARLNRALTIALWPVAALVFLAYFIADGEIRPATASGAAVRRRALRLCLRLLGRADGRCA